MLAELLAPIVLAVLAPSGDEQEFKVGDTQVAVRVAAPWPDALNKGWYPVFVTIENGDERKHHIRLRGTCWAVVREIEAGLELEARTSGSVELLVPAFAGSPNGLSLSVEVEGRRQHCPSMLGAQEPAGADVHAVLVLQPSLPDAGSDERWTSQVSTQTIPPSGGGYRYLAGSVLPPAPAPATTANNIRIRAARFDQMPVRSEAYSSLDLVVLDLVAGVPEAHQLAPLVAWVKLGGTLLITGARAKENARRIPELASWMEDRFSSGAELPRPPPPFYRNRWRLGLGSLVVDDAAPFLEEPSQLQLVQSLVRAEGIVSDPAGSRMGASCPVIPDLYELPLKAFAVFLILFAIVIGPVNFGLVRKGKRPALLLFSIPVIAFLAAAILFVFGVVSQGLGTKIASQTLTVLDQREHRASSAEMRMLFAGLSPGPGLVPKPGSSCYALGTYDPARQLSPVTAGSRGYNVDQTDGLRLSGQFIPARTPFVQQILTEHAERARLSVTRREGGFSVENGLGARILGLTLRDPAGIYHRLQQPLDDGASGALATSGISAWSQLEDPPRVDLLIPGAEGLPHASYIVELERDPFGDDCGITGKEVSGSHLVLGVLALDSEEWR